jgi:hypothetical protein
MCQGNYTAYLQTLLSTDLLRVGGVLCVDNTLHSVADTIWPDTTRAEVARRPLDSFAMAEGASAMARSLHQFNIFLESLRPTAATGSSARPGQRLAPALHSVLLPLSTGDGVTLAQRVQ